MKKLVLLFVLAMSLPVLTNAQNWADLYNNTTCEYMVEVSFVDVSYGCTTREVQMVYLPPMSYIWINSADPSMVDATTFSIYDLNKTQLTTVSVYCGAPLSTNFAASCGGTTHFAQCDNRFIAIYP